ncbi:hypothetical protein ACGFW5_16145 [Streptomyces sp. NPDC048416]|uniref:hypothetical protein n=1 Tax=Streptomyces sp. NPDC048416 TaxID=3365546 RepID=UPI00371E56E1
MAIPHLPPIAPDSCPLCGGGLETVELYMTNSPGSELTARFYRPNKMFGSKSHLTSLACRDCGHVLMFLANRGIIAPGK